jgi:hypothetical protein
MYPNIIKPIYYGNWLLRSTNDINIINDFSFIKIDSNNIKIKSIRNNGIIGIKKSRSVDITDLIYKYNNSYSVNVNFSTENIYSYSILGIEIPQLKTSTKTYNITNTYNIELHDQILFAINTNTTNYYVFDLYVGYIKDPKTETNMITFIFTQIFSIFISIFITLMHYF